MRIRDDALVADSSVIGSIATDVCLGNLVVDVVTLTVVVIGVLADTGVRNGIRIVAIVHNSGQHIRSDTIRGQREELGVVLGARAQAFLVRGILPSDRSADIGIGRDDGERGRDDADVVKTADVVTDHHLVDIAIAQVGIAKARAGSRAVARVSCRDLLRIGRIGNCVLAGLLARLAAQDKSRKIEQSRGIADEQAQSGSQSRISFALDLRGIQLLEFIQRQNVMSHKVGAVSRVIAFEVNSLIYETRACKAVIGFKPGIDIVRVATVS